MVQNFLIIIWEGSKIIFLQFNCFEKLLSVRIYLLRWKPFKNIPPATVILALFIIFLLCILAAHCVTNNYGDVLEENDYLVGAGKLYNKYRAPEDTHAQYLQVYFISSNLILLVADELLTVEG